MGGMSMNCMKCGRELNGEGVFCPECLEEMAKYPIKPGTVVHLPRRKYEPPLKKAMNRRKAQPAPEEQVKNLRKLVRRLMGALLITLVLLGVSGYFTVVHLLENNVVRLPGQNYSSVESTEETEAE